ncbi:MAG: F0F1 ATP synthase subunit gamma [Bdellovibrionales bacterium]
MPSLKDLKNRIASVKSTRKITSAMKMVAGSKLRRAQECAEAARPYATAMAKMLSSLASNLSDKDGLPTLMAGTGKSDVVLLLVMTSDRGLCGPFNGSVVRETRRQIRQLEDSGKQVKLLCVGRKGRDLLRRDHAGKIAGYFDDIGRKRVGFADADKIAARLIELYGAGQFDICQIVYNRFKSAMTQIVTAQQIIPVALEDIKAPDGAVNQNAVPGKKHAADHQHAIPALYSFEPGKTAILDKLLPHNLAIQLYGALLESAAGEQGARMTAMDNATRNAGDMINRLTLNYNRSRQAYITKELIEIISGAEAM